MFMKLLGAFQGLGKIFGDKALQVRVKTLEEEVEKARANIKSLNKEVTENATLVKQIESMTQDITNLTKQLEFLKGVATKQYAFPKNHGVAYTEVDGA